MGNGGGIRGGFPLITPPWLNGFVGVRYTYTMGLALDAVIEWRQQGAFASMPGKGTPTALKILGDDRKIDRGLYEDDASYAYRLSHAFDIWSVAGNALTLLTILGGYLTLSNAAWPLVRTVSNSSVWDTVTDEGAFPGGTHTPVWQHHYVGSPNWNWDGDTSKWWRAWVIVYDGPWEPEDPWGTGTWGDGGTWGSTATPEEIAGMRRQVEKFKSQGAYIQWIILSFNSSLFDPFHVAGGGVNPDGHFGTWSRNVAGTQVPTRFEEARYIDGPR